MRESKTLYYRKMDRDPNLSYEDLRGIRPSYMNALSDRNYILFAVLADVRNRGWVANSLFPHRGLPTDVSKKTMRDIPLDTDYHSHTYFTVEELLAVDWDKEAAQEEMAYFADQYVEWKDSGVPPADLEGADYIGYRGHQHKLEEIHRKVSGEEMVLLLLTDPVKKLVRRRKNRHSKVMERVGPYVEMMTPRTYRDLVPEFVASIPDLQELGPPDRVRIVIAFDN
jgi:hypothetical protein